MMKFFRKHKKAVSPVIAVMLLVAVAVAAVGAYLLLLGELTRSGNYSSSRRGI